MLTVLIAVGGNAEGMTVEEIKKAGDLRGLVAKLSDQLAAVRRDAAVALPGVVEEVKDPATFNREAADRAMRHIHNLLKVKLAATKATA